jgi:phosphatidylglycerophosphatase A
MWPKRISTVFGLGLIPFAPGTFGSFFALACSLPLMLARSRVAFAVPLILLGFSLTAGFLAVKKVLENADDKDPKWVVADEVAGQSLALLISPPSLLSYAAAFVFFRFFDILKPFPINRLEKLEGAAGVFADDLMAGLFSGAVVQMTARFI